LRSDLCLYGTVPCRFDLVDVEEEVVADVLVVQEEAVVLVLDVQEIVLVLVVEARVVLEVQGKWSSPARSPLLRITDDNALDLDVTKGAHTSVQED
jgi:hypothetical protein